MLPAVMVATAPVSEFTTGIVETGAITRTVAGTPAGKVRIPAEHAGNVNHERAGGPAPVRP
ncbi:hypothetical protein SAMN05444920_109175 [Nonomuraea solani]|uniref:Uncharacterized protein n=1 Tax=Nonomuraea solani TaxID=1144553 RepID=A0A1H6EDF0_9ACTN|nr:hypothetical protein SAMN05444920_109175 [Nonomuraea solani]